MTSVFGGGQDSSVRESKGPEPLCAQDDVARVFTTTFLPQLYISKKSKKCND